MFKMLVKLVFFIVNSLFSLILSPILSVIFALFPSLGTYVGYITTFLSSAVTYVSFILRAFGFSSNMMSALFSYYAILSTLYFTLLTVKFVVNVYNKFKM